MSHSSSSSSSSQNTLSGTLLSAVQTLSQCHQAALLYDIALKQINAGIYDAQIDNYLEVYLNTPNLSKEEISRALLTRAKARQRAGERAILMANQDLQALEKLDPTNHELRAHIQSRSRGSHHSRTVSPYDPPWQRVPLEVWERIASFIPRYHLRTWLSLSSFHRTIAHRSLFHTLDLYFTSDDLESTHRNLDLFDRLKSDVPFSRLIKLLRLHWAFEEGDMLDLMMRLFKGSLEYFRALKEFEWIGYPELRPDIVRCVYEKHPGIQSLGMMGWHFDASGITSFKNLSKFTLRAEDDDGYADMSEIRSTLDTNASTLTHLILGAYLAREHTWDPTFHSYAISNLTKLDLVDTRISHFVLVRILSMGSECRLRELTLHGTLLDVKSATVLFKSDYILPDGRHSTLPELSSFRFIVKGHDSDLELWESVVGFVRERPKMRRMDLGRCPWKMVKGVLWGLKALRVLGVRLDCVGQIEELRTLLRRDRVGALSVEVVLGDSTLVEYAKLFSDFRSLTFLHFSSPSTPSTPHPTISGPSTSTTNHASSGSHSIPPHSRNRDEKRKVDEAHHHHTYTCSQNADEAAAMTLAISVPNLDFVGWFGEYYVVVRKSLSFPPPPSSSGFTPSGTTNESMVMEVKELPSKRQLDCSKGVDLGNDDAMWLERKDVPIDYEVA